MSDRQRTIARPVTCAGVGLHTGVQSTLTFRPAAAGTGVRFVRVDLPGTPEIPAVITHACSVHHLTRRTSLGKESPLVSTVEHVLAAVTGLGIDNILIELNAEEPAEPDGSSLPFVRALREAGITEQDQPRRYLELTRPVVYRHDGVELTALPNPSGLRLSFTLQYDHAGIGMQFASFDITEDTFEKEISPARTFSLESELDALRSMGLIKGGTLKNAVVVTPSGTMDGEPLRFPNEFVRHKILDLLGDLTLLGMPLKAHVVAHRSGHISNLGLVKKLREEHAAQEKNLLRRAPGNIPSRWDISDIQQIMPHRYPFLLVDRIIDLKERERVVGIKNVTINEPFFIGHFPGHPIMPAVLIIEAMAQVGGVLLLSTVEPEEREQKLVYFMGIDNARFRKPVIPGDTLRFELELVKLRSRVCKMRGTAFVDGDLVAEAELTSTVVDR